jgi:hypothetical protein
VPRNGTTAFDDLAAAERVRPAIPFDGRGAPNTASPGVREFPVMAEEAFAGLPGEIVRAVAPHTESDPVGLLLSAHTFFGNCIGRGPHYKVEATGPLCEALSSDAVEYRQPMIANASGGE